MEEGVEVGLGEAKEDPLLHKKILWSSNEILGVKVGLFKAFSINTTHTNIH